MAGTPTPRSGRVPEESCYLDANATEPLRPEARAAVLEGLDLLGNPSSVHADGRAARRALERAREELAAAYGATPAGVVFTSGGTEANAMAVAGLGHGRRLVISAVEHDAVRAAAPPAVAILPVDRDGVADLSALEHVLGEDGPAATVCLMLANNETGTIQPVAAAAELCARHGALLHVDAVQAVGRVPVSLGALGAVSLAISGHKLGGPKGGGALLLAPGTELRPLLAGGGQERGRRGGTPPLPALLGLAAAARAAVGQGGAGLLPLREGIERAAEAEGAVVLGGPSRLPNTACLALPGAGAEAQVIALDLAGVRVSAGAACSSGKVARSHVLEAMGLGRLAGEAIRVSLPWNAGWAHVEAFQSAYATAARRFRASAASREAA